MHRMPHVDVTKERRWVNSIEIEIIAVVDKYLTEIHFKLKNVGEFVLMKH